MKPLEVDGSTGEGGGQIFRLSLSLAALTGRPVHVSRIRAGRHKPGLARQHLVAAEALREFCRADAEGLELGSTSVTFRPRGIRGGSLHLDVGTAGSVTLILQAVLLPALFAPRPTMLWIRGGTDVRWAPPVDYTRYVFLPLLAQMGGEVTLEVRRRGYYPRGGGRIRAAITPLSSLAPFAKERMGDVVQIAGHAHVANLKGDVPERMKRASEEVLGDLAPLALETSVYGSHEAVGRGGALVLWAETAASHLGASALAEKGVRAETLGRRAAGELRSDLRAKVSVDRFAADQLLPFMALASGPSIFRVREVSGHLRTLFWLLPHFLEVEVQRREEEGRTRVEVMPSRTWKSGGTPPGAERPGPDG